MISRLFARLPASTLLQNYSARPSAPTLATLHSFYPINPPSQARSPSAGSARFSNDGLSSVSRTPVGCSSHTNTLQGAPQLTLDVTHSTGATVSLSAFVLWFVVSNAPAVEAAEIPSQGGTTVAAEACGWVCSLLCSYRALRYMKSERADLAPSVELPMPGISSVLLQLGLLLLGSSLLGRLRSFGQPQHFLLCSATRLPVEQLHFRRRLEAQLQRIWLQRRRQQIRLDRRYCRLSPFLPSLPPPFSVPFPLSLPRFLLPLFPFITVFNFMETVGSNAELTLSYQQWDTSNTSLTQNGELVLPLTETGGGTKLSSTRAFLYGNVQASIKMAGQVGVVTAFITMSGVKDEIVSRRPRSFARSRLTPLSAVLQDWESTGSDYDEAQTNYVSFMADFSRAGALPSCRSSSSD